MKINIVNDRYTKISPFAFGTTFTNLMDYDPEVTANDAFSFIGIHEGKHIFDVEGQEYKIVKLYESYPNGNEYIVDIRRLNND